MVSHYNSIEVSIPPQNTVPANEITLLLAENELSTKKESKWSKIRKGQAFSLLPSLLLGMFIWFGIQPTEDLSLTAIHLLAVFSSCIFALITTSVDISMLVLTGLALLSVTHSFQCVDHATGISIECRLCGQENYSSSNNGDAIYQCNAGKDSFEKALEGFSSSVVWLIFAAFHLGKAVQITQLGKRVSLMMIKRFGKHTLGLAYAILLSELLLAPFVPSNTARGGGIVLPVVQSIATTLGSAPDASPEIGSFLFLVGNHANFISASMYLTGMAPNPIVVAKASKLFPGINFGFMTWLKGSIVPAFFSAACLPLIIRWSLGFSTDTPERGKQARTGDNVVQHAQLELDKMGPVSIREWQLCAVLLGCLTLWVTSSFTGLDSTLVALLGIVALLHMRTITWKDVSSNTSAWDTLFWLGGFVTIAEQLSDAGASAFLGHKISYTIQHFNLPPVPSLAIAYFLTTFLFSSLSAHTVAFAGTFLDAGHVLGASPMILTAFIAYFGSLSGCMTNFSTGMAAMYYAPGYVSRKTWFLLGLQLALFYLVVYFTIGLGWWSFLGWSHL